MSIFDKISSLITGSKTEKREPEKVSSSADDPPIVVVENPTQIKGPKPKKVIVVAPAINEPTKLPIKRKTQETVAHYPTKADLYGNIPLNNSKYSKYRKATLMLPEFDFYTGRNCDSYEELINYHNWDQMCHTADFPVSTRKQVLHMKKRPS